MSQQSVKCELTADIVHEKAAKGKVKIETAATVRFGPFMLGTRRLVGRWEREQVLVEFKKNHKFFNLTEKGKELLPVVCRV